jgi:hypothetical protein
MDRAARRWDDQAVRPLFALSVAACLAGCQTSWKFGGDDQTSSPAPPPSATVTLDQIVRTCAMNFSCFESAPIGGDCPSTFEGGVLTGDWFVNPADMRRFVDWRRLVRLPARAALLLARRQLLRRHLGAGLLARPGHQLRLPAARPAVHLRRQHHRHRGVPRHLAGVQRLRRAQGQRVQGERAVVQRRFAAAVRQRLVARHSVRGFRAEGVYRIERKSEVRGDGYLVSAPASSSYM